MEKHLTFLFTDIEGSTQTWEQHTSTMQSVLKIHDAILKDAIEGHQGQVVKTTGDGFHAAFESPQNAISAALDAQLKLLEEAWPVEIGRVLVRMGLHTGESQSRDGDYYGPVVNRCARIMSVGHGGQVLVSNQVALSIINKLPNQAELISLGEHSLRDLSRPETIHQLHHPELPEVSIPLSSLHVYKHNFPTHLSEFIGRDEELSDIKNAFDNTRLLTLLGPGGTGKSRLALQSAADLLDAFSDGSWLVELAPVSDPSLLFERVASVFNIQGQTGQAPDTAIINYLRRKKALLVFDNVEHLIQEAADLVSHLLTHCPEIKILITGREALNIQGEIVYQVSSLALPNDGNLDITQIESSPAIQFFLALARDIDPNLTLTPDNGSAVVEIARRLDGIPLALELAAARLRVLTVAQIAERLTDRFSLLTSGKRAMLPRQQTLQATIDWSWDLLSEQEQVIMRRLSTFSGGWTLASAQAVVSDEETTEYEIIDGLEQLLNKSMIVTYRLPNGAIRYSMLESILDYSRQRLKEAKEFDIYSERHAEFFAQFASDISPKFQSEEMMTWVDQALNEKDNALVAQEWAINNRLDLALEMTGISIFLIRFWMNSPQGTRWLEQVVEKGRAEIQTRRNDNLERGFISTLLGLGSLYVYRGDYERGRSHLEEVIERSIDHELVEQRLASVNMLLYSLRFLGDLEPIEDIAKDALAICQEYGLDFHRQMILGSRGVALGMQGETSLAKHFIAESISIAENLGNPFLRALAYINMGRFENVNNNLDLAMDWFMQGAELSVIIRDYALANICNSEIAHIERKNGELEKALHLYRETIIGFRESGIDSAVAHQLECFALITAGEGQSVQAATLFGAAKAIRTELQISHQPHEESEINQALKLLEDTIGQESLTENLSKGSMLDIDEAISIALAIEV